MSTAGPAPASTPPLVAVAPPQTKGPQIGATQHDAARQSRLLRDALESAKSRIGFFLGAGCPLGIFDEKGEKSIELIPDVAKLTVRLRQGLADVDKTLTDEKTFLPCWDALAAACVEGGEDSPNVEHILTELRTLTARRSKEPFGKLSKIRIAALDAQVCDLVVDAVGKSLPKHRCAYHRLASWIGGLNRTASIDVFTPNYDLLMEEAFEHQKIPHFDGFVGSREPFFDIASIEQDAIPRRWTRLWKLHGSINWQRRDSGGVFRAQGRAAPGKAMIYPSHLKYDQSRRMPYLAMIDRFRAFFRTADHARGLSPPVLIVCGYSFADDHLNEVLLDGLRGNPSAQCFALVYGSLKDAQRAVKYASEQPNLTVLAWDGAVVGTRSGPYALPSATAGEHEPWLATEVQAVSGSTPEITVTRCLLGDFHYFGLFLERLYGGRLEHEHGASHV
jgi:hypothetical protein